MSLEAKNLKGQYVPSPSDRVREQVALYEATNGKEGGTLEGRPVVILTTRGAKTGTIRKTPLIRIEQDGTYAVVASAGGAPRHPRWYYNVTAQPLVQLQDGEKIQWMRARELSGEEKARWWTVAESRWPHFPEYRATAQRDIPILALEPAPTTSNNPQTAKGTHPMALAVKLPGPDHPITLVPNPARIVVRAGGQVIADTTSALTMHEAAYPPVHYIPLTDVDQTLLRRSSTQTYCPYKGEASYYSVRTTQTDGTDNITDAVWTYENPYPAVEAITSHVAFYPDLVEIVVDDDIAP